MKSKLDAYSSILSLILLMLSIYVYSGSFVIIIALFLLIFFSRISNNFLNYSHICFVRVKMLIGFILNNIVLTVLYFFCVVPIAFFYKKFMNCKIETKSHLKLSSSYYYIRNKIFDRDTFEKMW